MFLGLQLRSQFSSVCPIRVRIPMTGPPLVSGFDNHCAVASTGLFLLFCATIKFFFRESECLQCFYSDVIAWVCLVGIWLGGRCCSSVCCFFLKFAFAGFVDTDACPVGENMRNFMEA